MKSIIVTNLFLSIFLFILPPPVAVDEIVAGGYNPPIIEQILDDTVYYNIPLSKELQKLVFEESKKYDLSYELVLAVMKVESNFDPNAIDYKKGNSKGLFQLHENTSSWIAKQIGIKNFNPFNPEHNIKGGVFYLAYLRDYYITQGFADESTFMLFLTAFNRGIKGTYSYIKKFGMKDNLYVKKVYNFKTQLEMGVYNVMPRMSSETT